METGKKKTPESYIGLYLLLILGLWVFCFVTLQLWLMPCALDYMETGELTAGYILYAVIGAFFSTPAPFVSMLIIALWKEKIGLRAFLRRIFYTEHKKRAVVFTGGYCLFTLGFALWRGVPNGSPWYMLPLGFLIMIPFVGIAEETGWRGFLEPALEKRFKNPLSVLLTATVWYIWHFDTWLDPTSNHYGDSLAGFGVTIFIWAFALTALYKATKSVFACAVYHSFVDAVGAVYDWNLLFDAFPGDFATNAYRLVWLGLSIGLWFWADRQELSKGTVLPDNFRRNSKGKRCQ